MVMIVIFFFSSRRRHTWSGGDWSSDVCASDLVTRRVARQRGLCAVGSDENGARRSWPKAVCLGFLRVGGARAAEAAAASAAKAGAERESAPRLGEGGVVQVRGT